MLLEKKKTKQAGNYLNAVQIEDVYVFLCRHDEELLLTFVFTYLATLNMVQFLLHKHPPF